MNDFEQLYKLCDSQVMLVKTDLDGNILSLNKNYEKYCGYSEDELVKGGFSLIRHKKVKNSFYKNLWEQLKNNASYNAVFYNISKSGKTIVAKNHIVL